VESKKTIIMARTEKEIKEEIEAHKRVLTGDIFQDGEVMQKIYELKKELNPNIEEHPEEDDEDGCLYCGS